jgi:cell division protein ZapA (FtsZ GTPase activity inhibitor)
MSEIRNYSVVIFQETYTVRSDEPQEQVLQAAARVDAIMHDIAQKSGATDGKKIAVLTALRLAHMDVNLENTLEKEHLKEQELIAAIDQELLALASFAHVDSSQTP